MKKVTIFYTQETDRGIELMLPFVSPPSLRDIVGHYAVVHEANVSEDTVPDDIFKILNDNAKNPLATKEGQQKLRRLNVSHTSMSPGDIVQLDDTLYFCRAQGWYKSDGCIWRFDKGKKRRRQ